MELFVLVWYLQAIIEKSATPPLQPYQLHFFLCRNLCSIHLNWSPKRTRSLNWSKWTFFDTTSNIQISLQNKDISFAKVALQALGYIIMANIYQPII